MDGNCPAISALRGRSCDEFIDALCGLSEVPRGKFDRRRGNLYGVPQLGVELFEPGALTTGTPVRFDGQAKSPTVAVRHERLGVRTAWARNPTTTQE